MKGATGACGFCADLSAPLKAESWFSRGLSREDLYRSFNGETKTELDTIIRVLDAMDMQLTVVTKAA